MLYWQAVAPVGLNNPTLYVVAHGTLATRHPDTERRFLVSLSIQFEGSLLRYTSSTGDWIELET